VQEIVNIYDEQYPEVINQQTEIVEVIEQESAKFYKTVSKGKQEIAKKQHVTGKDAFDLYQTYGFPFELTKEHALEHGLEVDEEGFRLELAKHQELSRTASSGQFASGLADHTEQTVCYHTATHLLHQALRQELGDNIRQRGSNITPERLRFDFTYPEKLSQEQLKAVEQLVNQCIESGLAVTKEVMTPEEAQRSGAIGLFGEKYGESVSVYSVGCFSKEICTGPHVENTKDLGVFRIVKEESVSAGVRRIKAVLE
jgi:alanyl-tRNA synthetase